MYVNTFLHSHTVANKHQSQHTHTRKQTLHEHTHTHTLIDTYRENCDRDSSLLGGRRFFEDAAKRRGLGASLVLALVFLDLTREPKHGVGNDCLLEFLGELSK
jgi:hypothetical protein